MANSLNCHIHANRKVSLPDAVPQQRAGPAEFDRLIRNFPVIAFHINEVHPCGFTQSSFVKILNGDGFVHVVFRGKTSGGPLNRLTSQPSPGPAVAQGSWSPIYRLRE